MGKTVIFPVGDSPAVMFAAGFLEEAGVCVREDGATHILLNVPAKEVDFSAIPENRKIIGGNLDWLPEAVYRMDLLKEERYVAENAALTADCAIRVLGSHLKTAFRDCPVLVIGFGRIGKCLAAMLKNLDCAVTVAARKNADRALAMALGYKAISTENIQTGPYRATFNTVPAPILTPGEGIYIDLASSPGIAGENVIWARALPGKMLPESSGKLIAQAIMRHLKEEEG